MRCCRVRWGSRATPEQASWLARDPVHPQVFNCVSEGHGLRPSGLPPQAALRRHHDGGVRASTGDGVCAAHTSPKIFRETKHCFLA